MCINKGCVQFLKQILKIKSPTKHFVMTWEQQAVMTCLYRGLEVEYPGGFEGGYVFVKDDKGKVYPVSEEIVAKWIKEDGNK